MHPAIRPCIVALLWLQITACPARVLAQENAPFAQQRYERGVELFDARRYADALDEFRASFEIYQSPNSRLYIARSLRELGRNADAVGEFEITAREASDRSLRDRRFIATREAAERERERLEPRVGRVVVNVANLPAGARVLVSGRELPARAIGVPMAVMPGTVAVTVELAGRTLERRQLSITEGQSIAVDFSLPAPQREPEVIATMTVPPEPRRTDLHRMRSPALTAGAIGGFGVAALAAVNSAIFAGLAARTYQDLRLRCGSGPCLETERDTIRAGQTYQAVTQVSLAIAAAGLVTGAVFIFSGRSRERVPPVQFGFTGTTIIVTGAF